MTDRTESPWRTLAERMFPEWVGIVYHPLDEESDDDIEWVQDLLIGRSLRYAWDRQTSGLEIVATDWIWMASIQAVTNSKGDARAIAALELLDAVKYGDGKDEK